MQKYKNKTLGPITSAIIWLVIWAFVTNALFVLVDKVLSNFIILILAFMVIYPVCTFALCFTYAKRNGLRWYMYTVMLAITVLEYLFVKDFNSISPNIIVMTILCEVFGGGIGNCFADKYALEERDRLAKQKKVHEDTAYKKILDD